MRVKWYISTLIVIFALFGIGQQRITVPNQEIVIEFTNANRAANDMQNTIAAIKAQLLRMGVTELEVHHGQKGQLKISYYSTIDVSEVKQLLARDVQRTFSLNVPDSEQSPNKESSNSYNLDVYELYKASDSEIDLEGHIVELKSESDRFYTPNVSVVASQWDAKIKTTIDTIAYNLYGDLALAIDAVSYQIPEVRAGPYTS